MFTKKKILSLSLFLALFYFYFNKNSSSLKGKNKSTSQIKIASLNLAADEILVDLFKKSGDFTNILALSSLADNPYYSSIPKEITKKIPYKADKNLEKLINLGPDLVFTASFNRLSLVSVLKKSGIKIVNLKSFSSISELYENYRLIGKSVHKQKESEEIISQIKKELIELQKISPKEKKKVLIWLEDGMTVGKNTLTNDLLTLCGGENILTKEGISGWAKPSLEKLATYNPHVLVTSCEKNKKKDLRSKLKKHPILGGFTAVKEERIIYLSPKELSTQSSYVLKTARHLCKNLQKKPKT